MSPFQAMPGLRYIYCVVLFIDLEGNILIVSALMLLWRFGPDKVRQSINRFDAAVRFAPHSDALCPGEWRFELARVAIARVGI